MLKLNKIGSINIQDFNAYDLNEGLIYVYKNIQSNKDELLKKLINSKIPMINCLLVVKKVVLLSIMNKKQWNQKQNSTIIKEQIY